MIEVRYEDGGVVGNYASVGNAVAAAVRAIGENSSAEIVEGVTQLAFVTTVRAMNRRVTTIIYNLES